MDTGKEVKQPALIVIASPSPQRLDCYHSYNTRRSFCDFIQCDKYRHMKMTGLISYNADDDHPYMKGRCI